MILTSLKTGAREAPQTNGLSYDTLTEADKAEIRASWNHWDVIGTTIILGTVLAIYLYFSFWL